jgi:hypothetical protein
VQTIFQVALIGAAALCVSDLLFSTARLVRAIRTRRAAEFDALGRRWIPIPELGFGMFAFCFPGLVTLGLTDHEDQLAMGQVLLAAVVFGYAGAVLSRAVRTPGPGGRRFRLRAGLLLGLPAVFGVVFGLSGIA